MYSTPVLYTVLVFFLSIALVRGEELTVRFRCQYLWYPIHVAVPFPLLRINTRHQHGPKHDVIIGVPISHVSPGPNSTYEADCAWRDMTLASPRLALCELLCVAAIMMARFCYCRVLNIILDEYSVNNTIILVVHSSLIINYYNHHVVLFQLSTTVVSHCNSSTR
jgi:hypothetical protein